jgi:hypothetical protein
MPWQPTGWYRFRSVARRIPGFWVMSCGAALAGWSVWLPAHPHWPLDANAPRLTTTGYGLVLLPPAAVCTGGALWWLHSRTYRPHLGDVPYFVESFIAEAQDRTSRHCWTGDPEGATTRADA